MAVVASARMQYQEYFSSYCVLLLEKPDQWHSMSSQIILLNPSILVYPRALSLAVKAHLVLRFACVHTPSTALYFHMASHLSSFGTSNALYKGVKGSLRWPIDRKTELMVFDWTADELRVLLIMWAFSLDKLYFGQHFLNFSTWTSFSWDICT